MDIIRKFHAEKAAESGEGKRMDLHEELVKLRWELHRNPELSFQELQTSERLKD